MLRVTSLYALRYISPPIQISQPNRPRPRRGPLIWYIHEQLRISNHFLGGCGAYLCGDGVDGDGWDLRGVCVSVGVGAQNLTESVKVVLVEGGTMHGWETYSRFEASSTISGASL